MWQNPQLQNASADKSCGCLLQAKGLASFLTPMLEYIPEKRATAKEMLSHPWLKEGRGGGTAGSSAGNGSAPRKRTASESEEARKRSRSLPFPTLPTSEDRAASSLGYWTGSTCKPVVEISLGVGWEKG